MEDNRLLLRPVEAADRLGISKSTMYELIAQKQIPSIVVGGCVRVPTEALRRWLSEQLQSQPAGPGMELLHR